MLRKMAAAAVSVLGSYERRLERFAVAPTRRPLRCGPHRVPRAGGDRVFALPERHDPVAAAGDLPAAEELAESELHADRPAHADLSGHRLPVAADGRVLHGSPSAALFALHRYRVHPYGIADPGVCAELRHPALCRGDGRHRVVRVPPGILAGGAYGLGRALRTGAVDFPGRRQRRQRYRPAAGRPGRHSGRSAQHRLVLARGARGHVRPLEDRGAGTSASSRDRRHRRGRPGAGRRSRHAPSSARWRSCWL